MPRRALLVTVLGFATLAQSCAGRADAVPDSPARPAPVASGAPVASAAPKAPHRLLTREDALFGLAATSATLVMMTSDRAVTDEAIESDTHAQRVAARLAQPLGNDSFVAPALLLAYGAARLTGHTEFATSTEHVAFSIAGAGFAAIGLKEAVGRSRPNQTPGRPYEFKPFSGHESFPSGHTTLAFAAARAIDREAPSPWVRAIVYPAAIAVAWSRIHDRQHWTSDVIAGAALGFWSAGKVEDYLQRPAHGPKAGLSLTPLHDGVGAGIRASF